MGVVWTRDCRSVYLFATSALQTYCSYNYICNGRTMCDDFGKQLCALSRMWGPANTRKTRVSVHHTIIMRSLPHYRAIRCPFVCGRARACNGSDTQRGLHLYYICTHTHFNYCTPLGRASQLFVCANNVQRFTRRRHTWQPPTGLIVCAEGSSTTLSVFCVRIYQASNCA